MKDDLMNEKHLPEHRDMRYLRFGESIIKSIDQDKRTFTGLASTPNSDRYKEVVQPQAFKPWLDVFKQNPILAANHSVVNRDGMPLVIGKIISIKITKLGLEFTAQMDDDPISEAWWQKIRKGFIRGISVGFIPVKWERKEIKREDGTVGSQLIYTEVELLEISVAPIPANRESLIAASLGERRDLEDPEQFKKLVEAVSEEVWKTIAIKVRKLTDARILELTDNDGNDGFVADDFDEIESNHDAPQARVIETTSLMATLKSMAAL